MRSLLHRQRFRFHLNARVLPGAPDLGPLCFKSVIFWPHVSGVDIVTHCLNNLICGQIFGVKI